MTEKLELARMIQGLRAELAEAQKAGKDETIRFSVGDVNLDIEIVMEEEVEGSLAAKFYVLTSAFKAKHKDLVTQKVRLTLRPIHQRTDPATGETTTVPPVVTATIRTDDVAATIRTDDVAATIRTDD